MAHFHAAKEAGAAAAAARGVDSLQARSGRDRIGTAGLPYSVYNAVGICTAAAWNFWPNGRWTWKRAHTPITRVIYHGPPAGVAEIIEPAGAAGR